MAQRILTTGPGFVDCRSLGQGRSYFVAGAGKVGIQIEAGTSIADAPGAPVVDFYAPKGGGSIQLPNDTAEFLRFRADGDLGTGVVWVTAPSASAGPYLAAVAFELVASFPPGGPVFTANVSSIFGMASLGLTQPHPSFLLMDFLLDHAVPEGQRDQQGSFALEELTSPSPFVPIQIFFNHAGPPDHVQIILPLEDVPPPPGSPDVRVGYAYELNSIPPS